MAHDEGRYWIRSAQHLYPMAHISHGDQYTAVVKESDLEAREVTRP